jgi:uncharacterized membrane protein
MTGSDETKSIPLEKNRLESLTDGIFAFAMTLLVTSMILPRSALITQTSGAALADLLPDFYHYIIAFFVLAAFWMSHHEQFSRVRCLDRFFLSLNIIGLFFVTLVPFSTSFIGDYDNDFLATVVFEANLLVLGMIFTIQWYYASRNHRLIAPDYPESLIRKRLIHGIVLPFISLAGIILAMAGSQNSTMIYMASPLISYVADRYAQGKEREREH